MNTLDLTTFPLNGIALIEASAGTGKTYALSNLYLRYLLERQLTVEQILVVTFTEAATQELKERIRLRIGELIEVFVQASEAVDGTIDGTQESPKGSTSDRTVDPVLENLFAQSTQRAGDLIRLRLAERQMDQAEIYTIHGFCQRMLKEYALDANLGLQQTLVEDPRPIIEQHCQDYWRELISALPPACLAYLYQYWPGPDALMQELMPLFSRRPEKLVPEFAGELDAWLAHYEAQKSWFDSIKKETRNNWQNVYDLVSNSSLKYLDRKLKWLGSIYEWSREGDAEFSFPLDSKKKNLLLSFTPGALEKDTKKNQSAPEHPYFHYLERTLEQAPDSLRDRFKVLAYQTLSQRIEQYKRDNNLLSFDDLILRMAEALGLNAEPAKQAEVGSDERANAQSKQEREQFLSLVRQRYGVALIDEFQDTDKSQYGIFSTLFVSPSQHEASNLVLIGDPKQAIYAFRGGDIATYLLAKTQVSSHKAGALFTMDKNWRSDPSMITAVNTLFGLHENPFMEAAIPFQKVSAGKSSECDLPTSAMTITQLKTEGLKKDQMQFGLARDAVNRIKNMLDQQHAKSADIAVLVRSSAEAELMKDCLAQVGISASFEGKSSIYDSEEAQAISLLLAAVLEEGDEALMKRCLAEPFWGMDDRDYLKLKQDVSVLEQYFVLFKQLRETWFSNGILAMIRHAMVLLKVYEHWQSLGLDDTANAWERRLSNVNQIAELLQQQARVYRSPSALVRWFHLQLLADHMADDDTRMRLESDEQLVRIVTIHKSKGLEYLIVFLPFLFSARGADEAWFYDSQGRMTLDLGKDEASLVQADKERLAEDMRLLYVALTRAKHHCYVGTCAYNSARSSSLGLSKTAWGYLCFEGSAPSKLSDEDLQQQLEKVVLRSEQTICSEVIEYESVLSADTGTTAVALETEIKRTSDLQAKRLQHSLYSPWRVSSFTGLMNEHYAVKADLHSQTLSLPISVESSNAAQNDIHILSFPKGSKAGTFLHTLFESIVFQDASLLPSISSIYASLNDFILKQLELSHLVDETDIESWANYLSTWVPKVLSTELMPGIRLSDLSEAQRVCEMPFHFPVTKLRSERLNQIMNTHGYAFDLQFADLEGQLKGAIDLVFQSGEQFYVLDYKSNYLGQDAEDYSVNQMQLAMEDHRYDLQYLLYTLALHRFLKHRLGSAYDYERDFGGVMYLYLRGLGFAQNNPTLPADETEASSHTPGVYFIKPGKDLIEALDREIGLS